MTQIRKLTQLCPIQTALLKEKVMLVDRSDNIIGSASKEEAHLMSNITKTGMLHRAFSLFLFNSDNKLLMQRRSPQKITFPNLYTNTCCSHPLFTIPQETDPVSGTKHAAIRRVKDELGITDISYEDIHFMTRIVYFGASGASDTCGEDTCTWGEHELDHVLIVRKDVDFVPNENEVSETRYIGREELAGLLEDEEKFPVTPWFRIIATSMLTDWWDQIDRLNQLGDDKIHEFSFPPGLREEMLSR